MKQSKLILISILSGIFLVLCGVLIWGIVGLDFGEFFKAQKNNCTGFENYTKVLEAEVPAEEIEELKLLFDKNSDDIYFYENDSEQILIEEYVNWKLSEKEKTEVTEKNGVLRLDSPRRDFGIINVGINNRKGYVNVYLPQSYKGLIEVETSSGDIETGIDFVVEEKADFKASAVSGDIRLLKVQAEKVDISSVSGDMDIEEIVGITDISTTSGDMDIEEITGTTNISTTSGYVDVDTIVGETSVSTVSGDVDVESITGGTSVSTTSGIVEISECIGDLIVSSVSGDITINSVTGKTDFDTNSGDIWAEEMSGACNVDTVSGDILFGFAQVNGDISVSTNSGVVDISIPKDSTVDFEISTTSGDIDTFFDDYLSFNKKGNHASGTYGTGDANHLEISSVSGDVRIMSNK